MNLNDNRFLRCCSLGVGWIFLLPTFVYAQGSERLSESMGAVIVRTLGALLFVLALLFLFVYLLKKFSPKLLSFRLNPSRDKGEIEIIESKMLAPKRFVYWLRLGERDFLIGSSEQGLSSLGQWKNVSSRADADSSIHSE